MLPMNQKFEACRNCQDQCWLQREAERAVGVFLDSGNSAQLANRISVISGRGKNELDCPSEEIRRVRAEIAKATKDTRATQMAKHGIQFSFSTSQDFGRPSLPLGQQRSVRGDRKF